MSVVVLGHLRPYKGVAEALPAASPDIVITVLGAADQNIRAELLTVAAEHPGRVRTFFSRVEPLHAGYVMSRATALLCPYRVEPPYDYFAKILHPSSVGSAVSLGVPVIAPDVPAVREMTTGHPSWLYRPGELQVAPSGSSKPPGEDCRRPRRGRRVQHGTRLPRCMPRSRPHFHPREVGDERFPFAKRGAGRACTDRSCVER